MSANHVLTMKSVNEAARHSIEGVPVLGYFVFWSIRGVNVHHDEFQRLLSEAGLDPEMARGVQARSTLNKAIDRQTKNGRGNRKKHAVADNAQRSSYAIVSSTTTDADNIDLTFQTETKITLDKGSKTVAGSGAGIDQVKEDFKNLQDRYLSDNFVNVVLRIIKNECRGLTVRERGGTYFVPSTYEPQLQKLIKLFGSFPGCDIQAVPIPDVTSAKRSTWKTFMTEASDSIQKLRKEVSELGSETSERVVTNRLEKIQELKFKVEQYEVLLSGSAEELKAQLNESVEELKRKLTSV